MSNIVVSDNDVVDVDGVDDRVDDDEDGVDVDDDYDDNDDDDDDYDDEQDYCHGLKTASLSSLQVGRIISTRQCSVGERH